MVIVEFSEYSHRRLTPKEIEESLINTYKDVCEDKDHPCSWEQFIERRTSSNRYCYNWETVSSDRIIGTGSIIRIFNSIIVPWLKERLEDVQTSQIYGSNYFNIIATDEDFYNYSFNIQKNDSLKYVVSKIKELVNVNHLIILRVNGPVDDTGRNFIEDIPLYDQDVQIERAKVK